MGNVLYFAGLDLSLTGTGIAVIGKDGSVLHRTVVRNGTKKGMDRMANIRQEVADYVPDGCVVALEGYAMGTKGKPFDKGELGGIVKIALYDRRLVSLIVPPTSLKRYATGNGSADKKAMVGAASRMFNLTPRDDNEADALILAAMARDWWTRQPLTPWQAQGMSKALPAYPLPFPRPSPVAHPVRKRQRTPVHNS